MFRFFWTTSINRGQWMKDPTFPKWQSVFSLKQREGKSSWYPSQIPAFLLQRYLGCPKHPLSSLQAPDANGSLRWERQMPHFPRGEDKYFPCCRILQVCMSPSPPHISENRACHRIIHHVLKILCTATGVFLKNKKLPHGLHTVDQAT